MEKLHRLFDNYNKNYNEWNELDQSLLQNTIKEDWIKELEEVTQRKRELYQSNNEIIEEIKKILKKKPSPEIMDAFFDEVYSMYLSDYHDVRIVYDLCQEIIPYYEEKGDKEKLLNLYGAAHYEQVDLRKYSEQSICIDMSYNQKSRAMMNHFLDYESNEQRRIIIAYYYYLVSSVDIGTVTVKEAFKVYYEFEEIIKNEAIKKVIESDPTIYPIVGSIREGMLLGVFEIDFSEKSMESSFFDYVDSYFKKYRLDRKSDYELSAIEYASYLFLQYRNGIRTKEEVFDKFLDYFEYNFLKLKSGESIDSGKIIENTNSVLFLANMSEYIADQKRNDHVIKVLLEFIKGRWVNGNITLLSGINEVLGKVCKFFFKVECVGLDRENNFIQLVIKRNMNVYLHGLIVYEIALAIFEEMIYENPKYYNGIKSITKEDGNLRRYIYKASLFHDIGQTSVYGAHVTERRIHTQEEKDDYKRHIAFHGTSLHENNMFEKYARVIEEHHKYTDLGCVERCEHEKYADLDPIVELIAIAVAIDEGTDSYSNFENKICGLGNTLSQLKEKVEGCGRDYMDLIEKSIILQDRLLEIVGEKRQEIMYDVYHNWEKIQLAYDEESVLNEALIGFRNFMQNRDEEAFKPYKKILNKLSKEAEDESVRGKAAYDLSMYYLSCGNIAAARAMGTEITQLLMKTGEALLQVKNLINQGVIDILYEDTASALEKLLTAAGIAEDNPECYEYEGLCYANIAYLYLKIHRYDKAIEYYDKVESRGFTSLEEAINIYCGKGFCYVFLKERDKVELYREKILKEKENISHMMEFGVNLFFAVAEKYLDNDKNREYITKLKSIEISVEDFSRYSVEMHIYIDLLEADHDWNGMALQLDRMITLAQETRSSEQIINQFVQRRMHCAVLLHDEESIVKFGKYLYDSNVRLLKAEGDHLLQVESERLDIIKKEREQLKLARQRRILEENVKEAQNANHQKSVFLSSMSHEIRTPINAIIGMNELILRESKEESTLQYAKDIENAGKQLLGIVNDVLDFSKIEAGKMEIVPQRYLLSDVINDIRNMFDNRMKKKNLNYICSCDPSAPNVLYGDEIRIKQILINLISNALKYTETGEVRFIVSYTKKDEKTIELCCEVRDTGIGLKPEQIEKLDSPFERFDLIRNRSVQGTGLGMSIVSKLLKQMGGELRVESNYGKGSSFTFILEQEVLDWKSVEENDKETIKTERPENTVVFHASKAEILVVDDNRVNLKVAQGLLKRTGAKITAVGSGKECLEVCKEKAFHVILLDHMMPAMDGVETLYALRQMDGPNEKTPVIALTANAVSGANEFYQKEGFDALLTKPMNPIEMEKTLRQFLPDYVID